MRLKFMNIVDWIKENIRNGTFEAGERLPTEEEMSGQFSCSRYTVRQALTNLEKDGLIYKIQGNGTYISENRDGLIERRRRSDSKVIGVILTNSQAHIFPRLIRGISDELAERGYLLSLLISDGDFQKEREAIERIMNLNPAGIILEPVGSGLTSYNDDLYKKMAEELPMIMIHRPPSYICPVLSLRDREGTRRIMSYLIEKGHTKIGSIYCYDEQAAKNRYMGYLDEMYAHGFEVKEENSIWISRRLVGDLFPPNGNYMLERMLKNVTAIVCHDDRIAYELVKYLEGRGIDVPGKISVVGYDDVETFADSDVKLTTMEHPKERFGANVAGAILGLINDPDNFDITEYEIEPEFKIRESTGEV